MFCGYQGDDKLKVSGSVASKRNSYDETQLAASLGQGEAVLASRTSSLPRNTRMVLEPQTLATADNTGVLSPPSHFSSHSFLSGSEVTAMTTEAMPTQSVPTETGAPRGGEGAKVEREFLRGESVESLRSDRSFTEESETK